MVRKTIETVTQINLRERKKRELRKQKKAVKEMNDLVLCKIIDKHVKKRNKKES